MAKAVPAPESFPSIDFPVHGVDVSNPFAEQRPGTTTIGVNCRAFEPSTNRARGGARPGLSRYLADPTVAGAVIQDLNVVVDPQAAALGISFLDVPFLDLTFQLQDPTGFLLADGTVNWVFIGGSGYYTSNTYKRKNPPPAPPGMISFVQDTSAERYASLLTPSSVTCLTAYDSAVTAGNLLIVAVLCNVYADQTGGHDGGQDVVNDGAVTVTDSLGNSYAQIDSTQRMAANGSVTGRQSIGLAVSLWYAISDASGSNTVTVIGTTANAGSGANIAVNVSVSEFTGNAVSPLVGTSSGTGSSLAPSSGTVTVPGAGNLVYGLLATSGGFVPGSGFSNLSTYGNQSLDVGGSVSAEISLSKTTDATASGTQQNNDQFGLTQWLAIGASFEHS